MSERPQKYTYHLMVNEEWQQVRKEEWYRPPSVEAEGFIHCSCRHQIKGVVERYYQGVEELMVLTIDMTKLPEEMVFEESTGGELFPHYYGALPVVAFVHSERFALNEQGEVMVSLEG